MYKCKKIRQEKHPLLDYPQYLIISAMVYFNIFINESGIIESSGSADLSTK